MRKMILAVLSIGTIAATWLVAPAAGAEEGCWTPRVGGFNTVQVCVLDDDILK